MHEKCDMELYEERIKQAIEAIYLDPTKSFHHYATEHGVEAKDLQKAWSDERQKEQK